MTAGKDEAYTGWHGKDTGVDSGTNFYREKPTAYGLHIAFQQKRAELITAQAHCLGLLEFFRTLSCFRGFGGNFKWPNLIRLSGPTELFLMPITVLSEFNSNSLAGS